MNKSLKYQKIFAGSILLRIGITACFILATACEEKIDWRLDSGDELLLIVEGSITNQKKAHEVRLSLPAREINGEMEPVSGALVSISDGDTVYNLTEEPDSSGLYYTAADVQGVYGKVYTLSIEAEGYTFTASASMDAVTSFQSISTFKAGDDPELYRLFIAESSEPAVVRLELDWSGVPGYDTLPDAENHAVIYHYTFDAIDVNEMFPARTDQVLFPPGTEIYAEKWSVSKDYENYLRGMLSETTWNGGVFDVKAGNPESNLSAGATGYFNASTVITYSTVFYPE